MLIKAAILECHYYARQPFAHLANPQWDLRPGRWRSNLGNLAIPAIDQYQRASERRLQLFRERQPPNPKRGRDCDSEERDQSYSPDTTHMLEGERPENLLSYIGTTCVAGHLKEPAAVARARIE